MGNFSQAIAAYDTALKIDPNYVNALSSLDVFCLKNARLIHSVHLL